VAADRAQLEAEIRRRCGAADWAGAATTALQGYGPEVLGFLYNALGDEDDARDGFSIFSEALFCGLPDFRWQCQFRTWTYALARSAMCRVLRDPGRSERRVALSQAPELAQRAESIRTATLPFLRSDVKARVRTLRQALDPDDQTLLNLRIDRGMPWREIAIVMAGPDASEQEITRESANLRKRLERIKQRIRALAPQPA
jgi:RNA polymerase sigma-70 factor, ECF subfamily